MKVVSFFFLPETNNPPFSQQPPPPREVLLMQSSNQIKVPEGHRHSTLETTCCHLWFEHRKRVSTQKKTAPNDAPTPPKISNRAVVIVHTQRDATTVTALTQEQSILTFPSTLECCASTRAAKVDFAATRRAAFFRISCESPRRQSITR